MNSKAEGIEPRSPVMRFRRLHLALRLLRDFLLFAGSIVPILAGLLHHVLPFVASRMLAARFNDGRPTNARARLGFGLPLMLATYVAVWLALRSYFLPWVAWTLTLAMPYCGFLALRKMRRLRRGGEALAAQARLCFQPRKLRALRHRQGEVRAMWRILRTSMRRNIRARRRWNSHGPGDPSAELRCAGASSWSRPRCCGRVTRTAAERKERSRPRHGPSPCHAGRADEHACGGDETVLRQIRR